MLQICFSCLFLSFNSAYGILCSGDTSFCENASHSLYDLCFVWCLGRLSPCSYLIFFWHFIIVFLFLFFFFKNNQLSLTHSQLGIWPTIQAYALTGKRTSSFSGHRPALNPLSHVSQGYNIVCLTSSGVLLNVWSMNSTLFVI